MMSHPLSAPSPEANTEPPDSDHQAIKAVLLDVDGTLVDSNYQHTIAWQRAFAEHGIEVPAWRIHRHMGMGGDQLVEEVAGTAVEDAHGDQIRAAEASHYSDLIFEVRSFEAADRVIEQLVKDHYRVVLASSAKEAEVEHYLQLIGAEPGPHAVIQGDDVDATKPEPELFERALAEAGSSPAETVMVGDSVWDIVAAERIGVRSIAVRTGGFPEDQLTSCGASAVLEAVSDLPALLGQQHYSGAPKQN
jgi:HAD superfamily hydrolase (TIGR01549 family)